MKDLIKRLDVDWKSVQPAFFVEVKLKKLLGINSSLPCLIVVAQKEELDQTKETSMHKDRFKLMVWMKGTLAEWCKVLEDNNRLTKDNLAKIVVHGALVDGYNITFYQAHNNLTCTTNHTSVFSFKSLDLRDAKQQALCMSHLATIRKYYHNLCLDVGYDVQDPTTIQARKAEYLRKKIAQTFIVQTKDHGTLFNAFANVETCRFDSLEQLKEYLTTYDDMILVDRGSFTETTFKSVLECGKETRFYFGKGQDIVVFPNEDIEQWYGIAVVN